MNLKSAFHWPRTLFARLALILCVGLVLAQTLSVWLTLTERDDATRTMMMNYIEREVASSVALLDHLPPAERAAWLPRLARRSYRFELGPGIVGQPVDAELSGRIEQSIASGIGRDYPLTANAIPGAQEHLQVHLRLSDGSPLTIDIHPMPALPLSGWLPVVLALQLLVLVTCCWFGVRLATRPMLQLATAADALGPDLKPVRLPEEGPSEVVRAAKAFNAMQERIATYTTERMQILAAISHDLQTPITRMRLRVDVMDDDDAQAAKLRQDLLEMESLVKEGVAYARTLNGASEPARKIDLDALLDSLVCDYMDAGDDVAFARRVPIDVVTRPQALRRIVGNLVDNALKYGGSAVIEVDRRDNDAVSIAVLDSGPGIPEEMIERVFEPFVRVETSRNRGTGGTGLGLAIARQLTLALNATLTLKNRAEGGLAATLMLRPPR